MNIKIKHIKTTPLNRPKNAPKIWSKRFEYLITKGYIKILFSIDNYLIIFRINHKT